MLPTISDVWLGSEATLAQVIRAVEYAQTHPELALQAERGDSEEEEDTRSWEERYLDDASDQMIKIRGRVGIVNIEGPLVSENSFWNQLFGLTSYDAVALALQKVMMDYPQVEYAVQALNTGGGSADGVDNHTNNVRALKKASDVTLLTHVQSAALSAGYWMGALGEIVYGNRMAQAGSIGVLLTHTSIAKYLEECGHTVTVISSGKEKAVGHPAKLLSKADEAILQKDSDKMYEFFTEHVASERHLSLTALEKWADGKTFFMEEAVEVGLADVVLPLNELLEDLNEGYEEEPVNSPGDRDIAGIRRGEPIAA